VCVCVCVCVFVCVCVSVCVCVFVFLCVYVCVCIAWHVRVTYLVCVFENLWAQLSITWQLGVGVFVGICVCASIIVYTYAHTLHFYACFKFSLIARTCSLFLCVRRVFMHIIFWCALYIFKSVTLVFARLQLDYFRVCVKHSLSHACLTFRLGIRFSLFHSTLHFYARFTFSLCAPTVWLPQCVRYM